MTTVGTIPKFSGAIHFQPAKKGFSTLASSVQHVGFTLPPAVLTAQSEAAFTLDKRSTALQN